MAKIAIVIVNYKTPDLVKDCLKSLTPDLAAHDIRVFIGDALSEDGSVATISDYIAQQQMDWALCFDIGENGGFAYGNNAVVRRYVTPDPTFDYVYFLNPDTYIHPGAITHLVAFLARHPKVGVAGSRLENPDGSWRSYGFREPTPMREFFRGLRLGLAEKLFPSAPIKIRDLKETREVDWVSGASFMVTRKALDEVGLMDADFFLYFEETDLMTRMRKHGYEVWHVAESRIVHLAGQSTGVRPGSDPVEKPISPHWLASRRRYLRKHFGATGFWTGNILFLAGDLLYRMHRIATRKPVQNPPHLWRDYLRTSGTGQP